MFYEILTTVVCQQEFNAGLFDYLIATDNSKSKESEDKAESGIQLKKSRKHAKHKADSEFGVVRGIDFKNVHTVCHYYSCWCFFAGYHSLH